MSMATLNPREKPKDWHSLSVFTRIEDCRFMLRVHGFLTDAESDRVTKRIDKWLAMHGMKRFEK